jgi:S1-C subfamily serine protease
MSDISYLNFDLSIERSGEGYRARVVHSPAGQASVQFSPPFSELELENFVLRIGRTRRGLRRLESPEMEAAKTVGGRLFEAVFDDQVLASLRSSLDEAGRQGVGLRIRLRLAEAPELLDVPWEYLYNSTLNRFLSLSVETPLVRYLELPERIRPLAVRPPLRVLVMISSPRDRPPLDVEREWENLRQALGDLERRELVVLERLEEATLTALLRRLRREEYHVFHFIGHGGFDQQAQDGVLIFEDEEERSRLLSGQYLGALLRDERTLRLAILNACEGARSARSDPFAGVAQSLVQQGVPAVIAMQFEITDEAAIVLAQEFYSALADGYPVDAALSEARKAIFARGNDVEWGTPVLYMRAPDGRIFDVEQVRRTGREQPQRQPDVAIVDEPQAPGETLRIKQRLQAMPRPWLWGGLSLVLVLLLISCGLALKAMGVIARPTPTQVAQTTSVPTPTATTLQDTLTAQPSTSTPTMTPTLTAEPPSSTPAPTGTRETGFFSVSAQAADALVSLGQSERISLMYPSLSPNMGFVVADTAYIVARQSGAGAVVGNEVNFTFATAPFSRAHTATIAAVDADRLLILLKAKDKLTTKGVVLASAKGLGVGDRVHLYSRRESFVEGTVEAVDVSVSVQISSEEEVKLSGVFSTSSVSVTGDSGTPVFDVQGRAVGIVVDVSKTSSIVLPMEQVCASFRQYLSSACQ